MHPGLRVRDSVLDARHGRLPGAHVDDAGVAEAGAERGRDVRLHDEAAAEAEIGEKKADQVLDDGAVVQGGDDEDGAVRGQVGEREAEL